jgi:hypothetical protein
MLVGPPYLYLSLSINVLADNVKMDVRKNVDVEYNTL